MSQEEYSIREPVQVLRGIWQGAEYPAPQEGEEVIEVSAATRRIAGAYERFRNTLEPEEADILRRNAIYRVLERRLDQNRSSEDVAVALIQELIRANYIEAPPKRLAFRVAQDITRARVVLDTLDRKYHAWFLSLVAVSIDRYLHTHDKQEVLAHLMYNDTYQRASWMDDLVSEKERGAQLYIGCYRVLFAADDYEISYTYFNRRFPAWHDPNVTEANIAAVARDLPEFYSEVQRIVNHGARHRLHRLLRPVAVPYRVLYDLLQSKKPEIWQSNSGLESTARDVIRARTASIRSRMNRRAWHSILFLLFTKTILTGLVEYPYEVAVLREVHWGALLTNIFFHPFLLLFAASTARLPGSVNSEHVMDQLRRVVTGTGELPTIILHRSRRYGVLGLSGLALIYTLVFVGIFWALFALLDALNFSLVAMLLFVIFLGLVVFLSFRIRRAVEEIRLVKRRDGFVSTLFSFVSLPILEFGRWLAENIQNINIILFFMDRVLEAPFKLLIDIIEDWFSFVRERKEEIV